MRLFRGRESQPSQPAEAVHETPTVIQPAGPRIIDSEKLIYSIISAASLSQTGICIMDRFLRLQADELGVDVSQPGDDEWRQRIDSGVYRAVIAVEGGLKHGMALAEQNPDGDYELKAWYVNPRVRGQGIGTHMLAALKIDPPLRVTSGQNHAGLDSQAGMPQIEAARI